MVKKRLLSVSIIALLLFAAGFAYGLFFQYTGIGLPCPVRMITGLKCPGCGVTHMCVALMQLDFKRAFRANAAVLLLIPVLSAVFSKYIVDYIRTGYFRMGGVQNVILWCCICVLVLFGIGRNIFPLL